MEGIEKKLKRRLNDGGSFDRLLKEAEDVANGDESKKMSLLWRVIWQQFVVKLASNRIDGPDKCILGAAQRPQRTLKRSLAQAQTSSDEQEEPAMIRNPQKRKRNKEKKDYTHDDQEESEVADLPEAFKIRIQEDNGSEILLVMEKEITESDLKRDLNRLLMPPSKVKEFLSQEEKSSLVESPTVGIAVLMVPPSLKDGVVLKLKRWKVGNNNPYVLTEKWHDSVVVDEDNGLEVGSKVQLWRFRKSNSDLCFVLVKV